MSNVAMLTILAVVVLLGCAAKEDVVAPAPASVDVAAPASSSISAPDRVAAVEPAPPVFMPPAPVSPPTTPPSLSQGDVSTPVASPSDVQVRGIEGELTWSSVSIGRGGLAERPALAGPPPEQLVMARRRAPASAEFDADAELAARRDAYRELMVQGSYAFNPPSPIKVATPVTVFFWIDPAAEPMRLAGELQEHLRGLGQGSTRPVEAGDVDWSPKMRVTLTGDDFEIVPTEGRDFDGVKELSAQQRNSWSWDIRATRVGERLPLHLRVWAVLPTSLGSEFEVRTLDEYIAVEVTWWWLLDTFWEKYWQWLLGGLGTALAGALAAWWNARRQQAR